MSVWIVCVLQVVIAAGHLQDVMKSVISNDERMQEANVSWRGREEGRGGEGRKGGREEGE